MKSPKSFIANIPIIGPAAKKLYNRISGKRAPGEPFPGSQIYWDLRYRSGGSSGVGSYGKFAVFKAEVINRFVREHDVSSVIEFGCGDGSQLRLAQYPNYVGLDVSPAAIALCQAQFAADKTKSFVLADDWDGRQADLALSLDVIYHLTEDHIFHQYMERLFCAAKKYVIIYSSNYDDENTGAAHVIHREFSSWIQKNSSEWLLIEHIPNRYVYRGDNKTGSFSDFYIYGKAGSARTQIRSDPAETAA